MVHAGLLHVGQTGVVNVQVLPGQDSYQGSDQNGAHSSSYGRWNGSYAFVQSAQPAVAGTWQLTANAFPGVSDPDLGRRGVARQRQLCGLWSR